MGPTLNVLNQSCPPKPKWSVDEIPDLTGKVIIVTGGNTGVGKEIVKALLQHNAKVYLAARSPERAEKAIEELISDTGKEPIFLQVDLSDLVSVRKAAEEFTSKENYLHVLFNNAGIMACPMDQFTSQGFDMQIGTNVVGHYFLTVLLLPALEAASAADEKARIVHTSSSVAYLAKDFYFDCIKDGPERQKLNTRDMYYTSKLVNALLARAMSTRFSDKLVVSAVNPGNLKSDLQRHLSGWRHAAVNLMLYPVEMGALTGLWAGVSPEGANFNGEFLVPWARIGSAPEKSLDTALTDKIWPWLEELCTGF